MSSLLHMPESPSGSFLDKFSPFSPLRFSFNAELPLETCIQRWQSAAESPASADLGLTAIELRFTAIDADTHAFQVRQLSGRRTLIRAKGYLQRTSQTSTLVSGSAAWNVPRILQLLYVLFVPYVLYLLFTAASPDTRLVTLVFSGWLTLGIIVNRSVTRRFERKLGNFLRQALAAQPDARYSTIGTHFPTLEERKWATYVNHFVIWVALLGTGLLFSIAVYLRYRGKSQFVSFHARQAIIWQLMLTSLLILGLLLGNTQEGSFTWQMAFVVMIFDWILWGPVTMLLAIIGAGKISRGETFRYPVIGALID